MVDQLVYDADDLIYKAQKKINAFKEAWQERGQEFVNSGMPEAARNATELVMDSQEVYRALGGLRMKNTELLYADKKLDKAYDKIKKELKV